MIVKFQTKLDDFINKTKKRDFLFPFVTQKNG